MNDALERFHKVYVSSLLEYIDNPVERGLATAYELGREAMNERLSSLDIAQVHHDGLLEALLGAAGSGGVGPADIERIMKDATAFRLETLSTFEITQRGYFEAQQLYERERQVADTLRESLLPQSLPRIPGIEVEAYYRVGGSGNQVGGDFYDLFPTGENRWNLLLGDVCGKGATAAAITAMARHSARTALLMEPDPTEVLALVNRAFLNFDAEFFCTMIHARIDKNEQGARVTFATGGHPQPYRLDAQGKVTKIDVEGPLIGVIEDWSASPVSMDFKPGDSVVLYTDGVTEARMPEGFFGDEGLREALDRCAGFDSGKIVATIIDALSEEKQSARRDDIAILVLRLIP